MASYSTPIRTTSSPDLFRNEIKDNFLLESNQIIKDGSSSELSTSEKNNFQKTLIKAAKRARKEGIGQLLRRGPYHLKRSVYITAQNEIFILNNTKEDRVIASGGQKKVKLALNPINGQVAAYKVTRWLYDPQQRQEIIEEYELGLKLKGDALCHPIEGSLRVESDRVVYLEQYMPHKDLTRFFDKPIERDYIIPLAFQMAHALAQLHMQGYISRDVKPANFFVESIDRGEIKIRLGDFGEAVPIALMTSKKQRPIWTPGYVSPEYKRAASKAEPERSLAIAEATTKKIDSWALGISMLTLFKHELVEFIDANPKLKAFLESEDQNEFVENLTKKTKWIKKPKNKNTLEYIIYRLLRINPNRRWTPKHAEHYLKTMSRPLLNDPSEEAMSLTVPSDAESMTTDFDPHSRTPSPAS